MLRLALFLLASALAGCVPGALVQDAPDLEDAAGYPNHSAGQIVAAVEASMASVGSVSADGDMSFTSPQESRNATYSLRSRLSDSTSVIVRGPLGVIAGQGLVTPDSVFLANRPNKEFLLGPISAAESIVPGASVDGRAVRAALGLLVPEPDVQWSVLAEDGSYRLSGRLAGGTSRSYVVDPAVWRVTELITFDAGGRESGSQTAEAFDTIEGVVMPRRVRLEKGGTVIVLEHRRLSVNPDDLRIRFRRPTDYETFVVR
ncbi:DUF4292 domain-containing protein [Rubrivirga sp.]|uniref:DUF4292 domain-containing protein n=1 Tax=Rubrivirga sp. TaxID=1885344 RepID=UPI003C76EFDC